MNKKYKISIVDDELFIREFMNLVFEDKNMWEVRLFENGKEFIESINEFTPDLIFLDLLMPIMSGFKVIQWLKKNNYNIPIIVFSALSIEKTLTDEEKEGITDYIIKPPSNPISIINKTKKILNINI